MTLLVITPSRGRPDNICRVIEAWEATAGDLESTHLRVLLDEDDPMVNEYPEDVRSWVEYRVGPRNGFAPRFNAEVAHVLAHEDGWQAIANFGDDHLPRTFGWDSAFMQAQYGLGRRGGVVYADDGWQGVDLPTAPVISTQVVRALGWYSPPGLRHAYVDNFWRALGIMLGHICYLPDVLIEHLHPDVPVDGYPHTAAEGVGTKATRDETYDSVDTAMQVADRDRWYQYRNQELAGDVARVRKALGW